MPGVLENSSSATSRGRGDTIIGEDAVAQLNAFIPMDRRAVGRVDRGSGERMRGAALYADVSGFTRLTEQLGAEYGSRHGAERLTEFLNVVFDQLIEVIHRHGGCIVSFAGDGMTCWFRGPYAGIAATAAALECRRVFHPPEYLAGRVGMKLAVTAGYASRLIVGDPDEYVMDVLTGELVDRMAVAGRLAAAGEIVIGAEVMAFLGDLLPAASWRKDSLRLADRRTPEGESFVVLGDGVESIPDDSEPLEAAMWEPEETQSWVNRAVYERIVRGDMEFVSEYRQVATLFAAFGGIDYDTDLEAPGKLDRFVRRVQQVLERYEGYLAQLIVGDKGSYFYASFGAPSVHEDDAERAVFAALDILDIAAELQFVTDIRVGISTGMMWCGLIGGSSRHTYGVIGEAANQAARLMEQARPGQVLVSVAIADRTEARFDFEAGPRGAAGHPAHLVAGVKPIIEPVRRASPPLIGRDDVLRELTDWSTSRHEPALFAVVGEAGIGKSRLLAEFIKNTNGHGGRAVYGAGTAIEASTPYFAWRGIFSQLVAGSGPQAWRETIDELFAEEGVDHSLAGLLNPILPERLPGSERIDMLSREDQAETTLDLMLALVRRRTPSVLVVDDMHWVDSASGALLGRVRRNLPDLKILVATRPALETAMPEDPPGAIPQRWTDQDVAFLPARLQSLLAAGDRCLVLGRLTPGQIVTVGAQRLGVASLPDRLRRVVVARAEGNPFFAEELLSGFLHDGLIEVEDERVRVVAQSGALEHLVPGPISTRLQTRLARLPEDEQTTLKVAAVVGGPFTADLVADLQPHPEPADRVAARLRRLGDLDLLTVDETGMRYQFKNQLIRDAAADLQVTATSQRIHAAAAAWIETNDPDTSGGAILARHWDLAGEPQRALPYHVASAEKALAAAAYDEAVDGFGRAIAIFDSGVVDVPALDAARWHMWLGEARVHQQGEDERLARDHLERGLEMIGQGPPHGPVSMAIGRQVVRQYLNRVRRRGTSPNGSDPLLAEAARAWEQLVEVYYLSGEDLRSLHASFRTLNLAEAARSPAEMARGYATLGTIVGLMPRPKAAERYLDRARTAAKAAKDLRAEMWVYLVAGFYYSGRGEWAAAELSSQRGTELARQLGDTRRYEDGVSHLMMEALLQGRLDEALGHAVELRDRAAARNARRNHAYGLVSVGLAQVDRGRFDEARVALEQLDDLGYRTEVPVGELPPDHEGILRDSLAIETLLEMRGGDHERGFELAVKLAERTHGQRPFNFSFIEHYSAPLEAFCTVALERRGGKAVERQTDRALRRLQAYSKVFPIGRPRLLLWEGCRQIVKDNTMGAVQTWREAADAAAELSLRSDEARILAELAHAGEADDASRANEMLAATGAYGATSLHRRE